MLNRRTMMGAALAAMAGVKARAARLKAIATPAQAAALSAQLQDRIILKGADDYERIRQFSIFNLRKPKRYPEAIAMVESVDDVVAAVKLARAKGWQIGVRSGGHSWMAPHTRDGAILINLAKLQEIEIDPVARIAKVSPSVTGNDLNAILQDQHGLMFPSAHGVGVGLGGFVMCGGHGWNARNWGPGCANLIGLDLVTAAGDLIHASETENSDYLWAARGGGPGFFAVAVRYYLAVHPDPKAKKHSSYLFTMDHLEEVATWVNDNAVGFPLGLEVVMIGRLGADNKPVLFLGATALADTDEEADAMLDVMEQNPAAPKATTRKLKTTIKIPYRIEQPTDSLAAGHRFAIDNIWTNAPSAKLIPLMRDLFTDYPCPKANIFWQCWGPVHKLPDMAYSVQGNVYLSSNAVYTDEADDDRFTKWAVEKMKKLNSVSVGAQMNDEDMAAHPARYLSAYASAKLERLRGKYDPEHRFVSFLKA